MATKKNNPIVGVATSQAGYLMDSLKAGFPQKDFAQENIVGDDNFVQICVRGSSNAAEREQMKSYVSGVVWANAN